MSKKVLSRLAAVVPSVAAIAANAAGADYSGMTGQIDWTTAIAAVLLVAGGLASVYVVMTGSGLINQKIKSGK